MEVSSVQSPNMYKWMEFDPLKLELANCQLSLRCMLISDATETLLTGGLCYSCGKGTSPQLSNAMQSLRATSLFPMRSVDRPIRIEVHFLTYEQESPNVFIRLHQSRLM